MRARRFASLLGVALLAAWGGEASARPAATDAPVLHEPIPPDPREDLAMHVSIDGELPAAIDTPKGVVAAPDPRLLPAATDATYRGSNEHDVFVADRDTRRPTVSGYDDPFTPATAPFKRVEAFDAVRADYGLFVREERLVPLPVGIAPGPDDAVFYADVVVDLESGPRIRIPSVGPGARVVRARLGVGPRDIPMSVLRDGADNWLLQPLVTAASATSTKARLVMEVAVQRGALGGPIGDLGWSSLPFVAPLPDNVARDAATVRRAIGVSRAMRPREALGVLVRYFRGFAESDDLPRGTRSLYVDLALSKKGVCRHRAFAFVITALSLGIPARFVMNEAHAWVEVHDGTMWRRIDLGGAGQMATAARDPDRVAYEPPADPFAWPQGAVRGDDMMADARARAQAEGSGPAAATARAPSGGAASSAASAEGAGAAPPPWPAREHDDRPPSTVSVAVASADVRRGGPLEVRGSVRADREGCGHLAVELWLRAVGGGAAPPRAIQVGTVATNEQGDFAGRVVVPGAVSLGDYDLVARTAGDSRCGASAP